ncbi:MAG: 23S rRNA (cytosine1962-C5)-methyltransferase [Alcanivorax sp.]|jgi:23S rRNA (cytosine1962-C5)-methyltransferase
MPELHLRKGADRRLRGGHLWVYSNECDTQRSPLSAFAAGDLVAVVASDGTLFGTAYMEPNNLICARLCAPGQRVALDEAFFTTAVDRARQMRDMSFDRPFYRLVYGDSDLLPGLVVDRYGDYLVVQFNNSGVERYEAQILAALTASLRPTGILLRADSRSRREQGLENRIEIVFGEVPDEVPLEENGVRFLAPVASGQKTGWFYDHRISRSRLSAYVAGKSVLDVYSYIGGWGVQAAAFGASGVTCVDSSESALAGVARNAELNALADRVATLRGKADEVMTDLHNGGKTFDVVILDPPAFIQRRKDLKKGINAYRRINELGLRVLKPGGLLVSGSCSTHLGRAELNDALQGAAQRNKCQLRIIEQGAQGPDHPIHPAIPETEYLKAVFARKIIL